VSDEKGKKLDFLEDYHKLLSEVDEVAQVVLNGHFEVEAPLDGLLEIIFAHSEYIRESRFSFPNKMQIARAYMEGSRDEPEWKVIAALNAVRNEIAHRRESERRTTKIRELRDALLEMEMRHLEKDIKDADEKTTIVLASSLANGFLIMLQEKLLRVRGLVSDD
jgi:hypothetical protein